MGDLHEFRRDRATVAASQQELFRDRGCISANLTEVQRRGGVFQRAIHASTTREHGAPLIRIVCGNANRTFDDSDAIARGNRDFDSIALPGFDCASRPPAKLDPSAGFGTNAQMLCTGVLEFEFADD